MPDVTVDGANVHYETAGRGFPLVLLHGIGSNSRSWRRQLTGLSSWFKVIAWDAPGYGRSSDPPAGIEPTMQFYADRLYGMLQALRLKRIFLVGHSTGGVIAQEFCRLHSKIVKALVLSDTRYVGSADGLNQRLTSIRTMTPAQLAAERAPKLLTRRVPQDVLEEVTSIMSEVRPSGYEFAARALAKSDTRDVVMNLQTPMLLIWGSEDEITPVWQQVPAAAQVRIIRAAGHLSYVEQPAQFNDILKEFFAA